MTKKWSEKIIGGVKVLSNVDFLMRNTRFFLTKYDWPMR